MTEQVQMELQLQVSSAIHNLNEKAMLVKLTQRKQRLATRADAAVERHVQQDLGDAGYSVYSNIFLAKDSIVRSILNAHGAVYAYHKKYTLAYEDRGYRLLPVAWYETYRDAMRNLQGETENIMHRMTEAMYNSVVQADISERAAVATANGKVSKASVADYPTYEQFKQNCSSEFRFSPMPDVSHWLFDVSDEDKQKLIDMQADVQASVKDQLIEKLRTPMQRMLEKLKIPAGQPGAIFRDTLVENMTEAIEMVRAMAMDDPEIIAACDALDAATMGHARNPQVLRDSPIVREQTVEKLKEVQDKLAWMFGGQA